MKILLVAFALASLLPATNAIHAALQGNTTYCVILDANLTGVVSYHDFNLNKTVNYEFNTRDAVSVDGSCHKVENQSIVDVLNISFFPIGLEDQNGTAWTLKLTFKENPEQTNNAYSIASYVLTANFDTAGFNSTEPTIQYNPDPAAIYEWVGEEERGFACSKSALSLVNGEGDLSGTLTFSNLRVVAFAAFDEPILPTSQQYEFCRLDMHTDDIVPVIVGAALALLVVVVLIAYLIGRSRARRLGYASV